MTSFLYRNPVARAVARRELNHAVVEQKVALYSLDTGDPCANVLAGVCAILQGMQDLCSAKGITGLDVNILRGGLSACLQVMQNDRFDASQAGAIAIGLDKALILAAQVKPSSIQKAMS